MFWLKETENLAVHTQTSVCTCVLGVKGVCCSSVTWVVCFWCSSGSDKGTGKVDAASSLNLLKTSTNKQIQLSIKRNHILYIISAIITNQSHLCFVGSVFFSASLLTAAGECSAAPGPFSSCSSAVKWSSTTGFWRWKTLESSLESKI